MSNRCRSLIFVLLCLAWPLDAWPRSPVYGLRDLVQLQNSDRLDIRLKRLGALLPLGLPPTLAFRRPGAADSTPARLPKAPALLLLDSADVESRLRSAGLQPHAQVGRVVSAYLDIEELDIAARFPGVVRIQLRRPYRLHLDVNTTKNGAVEGRASSGLTGDGVLLGFMDTGLDWSHPDFLESDGTTRVRVLWDQLDDSFASSEGLIGTAPPVDDESGNPLGTVYTREQLNAALAGNGTVNSVDMVGHGTHVAGCAASNGQADGGYRGVAPGAELLVVRVGGRSKDDVFIEGDILAALQWLGDQAAVSAQPIAVNISFGEHSGAHDGTSAEELAITDFVSVPGRVVAVSAGNEREARIHTSGSARRSHALQIEVGTVNNQAVEIDCWLSGADIVDLGFIDPTGFGLIDADVPEGECVENEHGPNRVSLCVDVVNPTNGDREVLFRVEPSREGGAVMAGNWQFLLRDEGGVTNGHYDCWSAGFQPFTADVDRSLTVAIPGTSADAITAGAAVLRDAWPSQSSPETRIGSPAIDDLAFFSSVGPTRDGRIKPDLVTGGYWVVSSWSQGDGVGSGLADVPPDSRLVSADGAHVAARGTSFSAPQVAGAAALLLQAAPTLSAREVTDMLRVSARQDLFTGTTPNPRWGYGKLAVDAAVAMVGRHCTGDCNGDGVIGVDELVTAVGVALGEVGRGRCLAADRDGDRLVSVDELVAAVGSALSGCGEQ